MLRLSIFLIVSQEMFLDLILSRDVICTLRDVIRPNLSILRDVVSLSRIVFLLLRLSGFSSLFVLKRCCQSVLRFGAWCLVVDYFSSFLSVVG